jgi:hypothetical protein
MHQIIGGRQNQNRPTHYELLHQSLCVGQRQQERHRLLHERGESTNQAPGKLSKLETGQESDGLVRPLLSQTATGVSVGGEETEVGLSSRFEESDFVVCGGDRVRLGAEKKIKKNLKKKSAFEVFARDGKRKEGNCEKGKSSEEEGEGGRGARE